MDMADGFDDLYAYAYDQIHRSVGVSKYTNSDILDALDLMEEMYKELKRESKCYQDAGFKDEDPLLPIIKKFEEWK